MKMFIVLSLATAATSAFICTQPPGGDRHGPPRDPFFELFDTDENGEISMEEIDAAAAILKKRDTDNSGSLTRDELPRPPRRGEDGVRDDRRGDRPGPPPPRDGHKEGGGEDNRPRQRPQMDEEDTNATSGTVFLRGGYETDPVDKGRPVALIAAALGVKAQIFRDAFSNVRPASFGPPSAARATANKKVLMDALGPHGITNDRLDEVSNYYRYRPGTGELWTVTPATVKAVIEDGNVMGFEIVSPGAGYSSPPIVSVAGHPNVRTEATIEFTTDLRTNGRIKTVTVVN